MWYNCPQSLCLCHSSLFLRWNKSTRLHLTFRYSCGGIIALNPIVYAILRYLTSGTLSSQTAVFLTSSLYHFGDTCLADLHFTHFFAVPLRGHFPRRPLFSSLLRYLTSGTLASQTAILLISSLYHFGDTCLFVSKRYRMVVFSY